jgi:5-methyltetrahydrofolate--homocysteine methyltransferase
VNRTDHHNPYVAAARESVLVYDGATGTNLQTVGLGPDDFGGVQFEGCNELLNVTRPDVVAALHESFLEVGVDVVETNTFGAFAVPLREYGIPERAYELAKAGARIARETVDTFATVDRPRWVAGSIGPGTKFASLGQISYRELRDAYEIEARGLIDGGVDLFIIETQFDLLGLKAAVAGCRRAMASTGKTVPIQAQVTLELTGRMLGGTEIAAALASIESLRVDVIGLNCATGPEEMFEPLRYLSRASRVPISAIPNAGLPTVADGQVCYNLEPEELADLHSRFVTELGVTVIGGCCGTTPEHMRAVADRCRDLVPARRTPVHEAGAASTYSFVPFHQDTSFLIIGERTNANGSRAFRDALLTDDWDSALQVARDQVAESAHLLDVSVDYVGRDGVRDMTQISSRFSTGVTVPLVLDSTEPDVIEAGLEHIGGRSVLNSANLEDGDGPDSRADRVFKLAVEHGAAVICLLIDEQGQARDVEWKLRVAHRLYDLAVGRYGLEPSDLIFDALTFPLTTGDESLRGDAMATIEAIRRIKAELPGVSTTLGISNVSFGINPRARQILNTVFLNECLAAGLDSAIVHAGRIIPLARIPEADREVCRDLIYDRRRPGYDPLQELLSTAEGPVAAASPLEDRTGWPVEERLSARIIDGSRDGLVQELDEALATGVTPLDIINDTLLDGMRVVGERFARGEMQLPFVLQSAETMKAAVTYLETHMHHADGGSKGTVVLATVKGDVHDIGKNLVDIILTNNGYTVHNLGIKVDIGQIIDTALEVSADAIGMSGLLVKSTLVMRDNLEELNRRELTMPVMLGGAALTRRYVEQELRAVYPGPLFYGRDAFAGLDVMDRLGALKRSGKVDPDFGRVEEGRVLPRRAPRPKVDTNTIPSRSPHVAVDTPVFTPPFLGSRVVKGIPLAEIAVYLNQTALFRNQWQYRPQDGEDDAFFKERLGVLLRDRLSVATADDLLVPQIVYGFYPVNSEGNDLIVWTDESRTDEHVRFSFPRQQADPYLCIADFFRPMGEADYAAFHVVTMGSRVSERTAELFAADRYQEYLWTHGLGVEMTEALAEFSHTRIREEWGFAGEDDATVAGLFRQRYRGGRYSWGYPACPNLEDNVTVADLLDAGRIGVTVGPETAFQYQPEQTTSALICHHPAAKYFVARES